MKKLMLLFPGLLLFTLISAQYADSASHQEASMLYKKANKQKTTGWILLGGGAGVTLIGSAIGVANVWDEIIFEERGAVDAATVMVITGLVSMVGSIPFFIASGKNKKKGAGLVFIKIENSTHMNQFATIERKYPAVALKIGF
jgi:hypothetical protein